MWEFYLISSEASFRYGGLNNFQIQFARHQYALPITRNYMMEEEERLKAIDSQLPRFKSIPAQ
jgi:cyclopropane-fatty-acyl-phospholipid synthase